MMKVHLHYSGKEFFYLPRLAMFLI